MESHTARDGAVMAGEAYATFLQAKAQYGADAGFPPIWLPSFLYDFQSTLCDWAIRKGRGALFADTGLGKGPMALVWAENVVRYTNRSVLIATPLAVSHQLLREAEKFGVACIRSTDGRPPATAMVAVTNYERLHLFSPANFAGMVCDESAILKNFDGVRRKLVTEFLRVLPYRLLCTATAAPNDYVELGTSSEALGELGHMDMLGRFFKNQNHNTVDTRGHWRGFSAPREFEQKQWRFKRHAEQAFWRWVCSWARALRKPSDVGGNDAPFALPPLNEIEHIVSARTRRDGMLFDLPAVGLADQREERRRTIAERCEALAQQMSHRDQALVWCHLNPEGDLLTKLIPGAVQVAGSDSDEAKEERLLAFANGEIRCLVTKPKIGAWGLNLQRCAHIGMFPSHSFEQYYQAIRRCWRFGQMRPVRVDIVATEGERGVLANLRRKQEAADRMFEQLITHMQGALRIAARDTDFPQTVEVPAWL